MKKLIAIAALFVCVTAAVLAQDGEWKVGFLARHTVDMLYVTGQKEKLVVNPLSGQSYTWEFGNYAKGTVNFFQNDNKLPHADNRLGIQLSNEGENYKVFLPMEIDNWVRAYNKMAVGDFLLNAQAETDWYIRGNAGIFDGQIGSESYTGYVDSRATWNGWLGAGNTLNRFGVWRAGDTFVVSQQFRTWNEWGTIVALGVTPVDNFRFSIGYRVNPITWSNWNPGGGPEDSRSSINASFLFSGRPVDGVSFDLFYAVLGADTETRERPRATGTARYAQPAAFWRNTIGAYVGLDIIDNLGISLGYAVNFNAYESGGWWVSAEEVNREVKYSAPIYSGIDLHLKYSGIDNVPITFNNNVSFAGVKGEKTYTDPSGGGPDEYWGSIVYNLAENAPLGEGYSQDYFHWDSELTVGLGFIDGVSLTLGLGEKLGVQADNYVNPNVDGAISKTALSAVTNDLRVSLFAEHGVGAVSVGAGLFFGLVSNMTTYDVTFQAGVGSGKLTYNKDVVTFGIPLMFKVAF